MATFPAKSVYVVHHHPHGFAGRSGFPGLMEATGAREISFDMTWKRIMARSWRMGQALRDWGARYYGSTWNGLVPYLDEWRLARQVEVSREAVVHFIWGEFASPRHPAWFRKRGNRVVSTFHCSIRRLPTVLENFKCWNAYDAWSVTSKTQIPFFLEHGVHEQDIRVVPLGVDTDYFRPDPVWRGPEEGPLQAILVGKTERDHEFVAEVMRVAPTGLIQLKVCTAPDHRIHYRDVPGVEICPHIPDVELLRLYQTAELMVMPFLDCTTNDALMECMACGTPIMTNRIGGIPEYVDAASNVVMDGKRMTDWVDRLVQLKARRDDLWAMRGAVRRWAERFAWPVAAEHYRALYEGRAAP